MIASGYQKTDVARRCALPWCPCVDADWEAPPTVHAVSAESARPIPLKVDPCFICDENVLPGDESWVDVEGKSHHLRCVREREVEVAEVRLAFRENLIWGRA